MTIEGLKQRFRATASFWESDRIPEPPDEDLDTDLIPEAWLVEAQSGFDLEKVNFPEIVSISRDEQESVNFEARVEERLRELPPPPRMVCLSPRPDGEGLNVPIWVDRLTLTSIVAELHAPNDIEGEAFSRWVDAPLPLDDFSVGTLPHAWTDWIQRAGFDLWLLRYGADYGCPKCRTRFQEMKEEFHLHGSEHNVHIRCPNGHTIYYKTVAGPYRF